MVRTQNERIKQKRGKAHPISYQRSLEEFEFAITVKEIPSPKQTLERVNTEGDQGAAHLRPKGVAHNACLLSMR